MKWNKIGNATGEICTTNKGLYALTSSRDKVFKYTDKDDSWLEIGGPAKRLIGGGNFLYAVNPSNTSIWRYTDNTNSWDEIGTEGFNFVCAGNRLFGLNPACTAIHIFDDATNTWKKVGDGASQIYGNGDHLYVMSPDSKELWKYIITEEKWEKIGGPGSDFCGHKNDLYALNPSRDKTYLYDGDKKEWKEIGGGANGFYGGGDDFYSAGTLNNELWRYSKKDNQWHVESSGAAAYAPLKDKVYLLSPRLDGVYKSSNTPTSLPAYLGRIGAKKSTVSEQKIQQIIERCAPIWIIAKGERFTPKSFQDYKANDIKCVEINDDKSANFNPWDDRRHHYHDGSYNHTKFKENIIEHAAVRLGNEHNLPVYYPRATPTYAFYQEMTNGNIWVRYFLFFGYNEAVDTSIVGKGDHLADFVHISVELKPTNTAFGYIPINYYFSAHSEGKRYAVKSTSLDFYVPKQDNPFEFDEKNFTDLNENDPWHVGVFCAKGSHECYANSGTQTFFDNCSYGSVVVPFLLGVGEHDKFPVHTKSPYKCAPIYAWNMSAPQYNSYLDTEPQYWENFIEHTPFIEWIPKTIFPSGWGDGTYDDGRFTAVWFTRGNMYPRCNTKDNPINRPIKYAGEDDTKIFGFGNSTGESVKVPSYKIFDWGTNFDK